MFRNRCNNSVTQTDHDSLVSFTAAVTQQCWLYDEKCLDYLQIIDDLKTIPDSFRLKNLN